MDDYQPVETHDFWDLLASFIKCQVIAGAVLIFLLFLIITASEALHFVTGGRVPQLIEWQPKPHTEVVHGPFEE